jgi:hypothetical protein
MHYRNGLGKGVEPQQSKARPSVGFTEVLKAVVVLWFTVEKPERSVLSAVPSWPN